MTPIKTPPTTRTKVTADPSVMTTDTITRDWPVGSGVEVDVVVGLARECSCSVLFGMTMVDGDGDCDSVGDGDDDEPAKNKNCHSCLFISSHKISVGVHLI